MKRTKEQLIAENVRLETRHETVAREDERLRRVFSTVLGAPGVFEYGRGEVKTYSWEEIFTEVGKLLKGPDIDFRGLVLDLLRDVAGKGHHPPPQSTASIIPRNDLSK